MKPTLILLTVLASLAAGLTLSGCNSSEPTPSPDVMAKNRTEATNRIPPQAQGMAAQENQAKSQLDAQRAKDAAKGAH